LPDAHEKSPLMIVSADLRLGEAGLRPRILRPQNNESGRVIDRFQTSCDAGEELLLLRRLLLGRLLLCSCFLLSHRNHSLSEPRVMIEPLLPGKIGLSITTWKRWLTNRSEPVSFSSVCVIHFKRFVSLFVRRPLTNDLGHIERRHRKHYAK
jgi:hypothetical protein